MQKLYGNDSLKEAEVFLSKSVQVPDPFTPSLVPRLLLSGERFSQGAVLPSLISRSLPATVAPLATLVLIYRTRDPLPFHDGTRRLLSGRKAHLFYSS
jgi:hypothetical protein